LVWRCVISRRLAPSTRPRTDLHRLGPGALRAGLRLARSAVPLERGASLPAPPRDAVASIMDTFPIVRRRDEAKFDGDYRTRRVILAIYDALAESMRSGSPTRPASTRRRLTRAVAIRLVPPCLSMPMMDPQLL
jgi:hypothetical protein